MDHREEEGGNQHLPSFTGERKGKSNLFLVLYREGSLGRDGN